MNTLLYDGDCGFCNFWVQWILKHDKDNKFRFAALQSKYGQDFLKNNNFDTSHFDTVYLINSKGYFKKLDAIAEVGPGLGGFFNILFLLKFIPDFISNKIYDWIAKNRQSLANQSCMLPTPEERKKFITD